MPEPNRLPYQIDDRVGDLTIGRLIEERAVFILQCTACCHDTIWGAVELRLKFPGRREVVFDRIANKLRCAVCRSEWIQVIRLYDRRAEDYNAMTSKRAGTQ